MKSLQFRISSLQRALSTLDIALDFAGEIKFKFYISPVLAQNVHHGLSSQSGIYTRSRGVQKRKGIDKKKHFMVREFINFVEGSKNDDPLTLFCGLHGRGNRRKNCIRWQSWRYRQADYSTVSVASFTGDGDVQSAAGSDMGCMRLQLHSGELSSRRCEEFRVLIRIARARLTGLHCCIIFCCLVAALVLG